MVARVPEPPETILTPDARAVLSFARTEAAALDHHYLGTEHVLLGLMQEGTSNAARVLSHHTDIQSVRERVQAVAGAGRGLSEGGIPTTERAAQVLHYAQREAKLYGDPEITPDHLLIGTLREGEGTAARVLVDLGIDLGELRVAVTQARRERGQSG